MKKNKWLTLLSLVLGASTILSACGDTSSSSSSSDSSTDAAPVVEATFSNFIHTEYKADWKDMKSSVVTLNDEYGTCIDGENGLYLFKKEGRSFLNEIVQTWTLYNAKYEGVVWKKEHKYEDGKYINLNNTNEEDVLPVEVEVSIEEVEWFIEGKSYKISYLKVVTVNNEAYSNETVQLWKDETGDGYKSKTTTEYYSVDGKLITSTQLNNAPVYGGKYSNGNIYVSFGKTVGEFAEDGKLVAKWNSETDHKVVYVKETAQYGYTYAMYGGAILLQAYDKADNTLVYSRALKGGFLEMGSMTTSGGPLVLANGDIVMQDKTATDNATYDYLEDDVKYNVTTSRIDLETGKETAAEFNYVIESFIDQKEWEETHHGFSFSENVYNVAYAKKIEDGILGDQVILFFDNALNVQYEWAPLIPEQVDWTSSMQVLETGDLLIDLATEVKDGNGRTVNQAIVTTDGALVCYVPKNSIVIKEYIVPVGNNDTYFEVYNFNGEQVDYVNLDQHVYGNDWRVDNGRRVGDRYVFECKKSFEGSVVDYKWIVVKEATGYGTNRKLDVSSGEQLGKIRTANDSYLVTEKDGQYCLYDGELDLILKMSNSNYSISEYDDCFVVETWFEGEKVVYVIPVKNSSANEGYKPDTGDDSSSSYKGGN